MPKSGQEMKPKYAQAIWRDFMVPIPYTKSEVIQPKCNRNDKVVMQIVFLR